MIGGQDFGAWRTKLSGALPVIPSTISSKVKGSVDVLFAVDRGVLSKDNDVGSRGRSTLELGARWLSVQRQVAFRLSMLMPIAGDDTSGHAEPWQV